MSSPLERGPLIQRDVCADCAKPLFAGQERAVPWFTCGVCGKSVCEDCRKTHIPKCMALTWGMAKEDKGELVQVEKPSKYAIK